MTQFSQMIEGIKRMPDFSAKNSILTVILNSLQSKKAKFSPEGKKELADFAFSEVKVLLSLIPTVKTYKEKDDIFCYEDSLLGIVMLTHASPDQIPESHMGDIRALVELVNKERFVENAINEIFDEKKNEKLYVERLICAVSPLTDEYQRAQVFNGLLHYRYLIADLPADSKQVLADHIASEISRFIREPLSSETVNSLEIACDVAKFFISDTVIALLYDALKLGRNNINAYAVGTLLEAGAAVPDEVIVSLANDLEYADMTYAVLKEHGREAAFPAELANPEYLAKSDLVHWLTYPTELGRQPDQIEYLGKVKKKEEYYIFRYTSDSDCLDDDLKGVWLIGWSNPEGGTFSNFDRYADFEQKTMEKTLKNIRKKLL